jgi:putative Ig domain-containing protein
MGLASLDPDLSSNGTLAAGRETPATAVSERGDKGRAVAGLLQNKFLSHTFGIQGEWEVRTTLVANRQAWRYRSSVFLRGKEIKKGFVPMEGDWTQRIRQAKTVTEETLAAFAGEAVEWHFARCANVADYSMIAAIYSEPLPRHQKLKRVALILLSIAVLFTAFGLWTISRKGGPVQADREAPAPGVSWQSRQVSYQSPAGEPFMFPLPPLARMPEGIPVDVTLEASGDEPGWLQLDPERLTIGGTPPRTADDRTFQLRIRAQAEQGSDSSLLVVLTISGQPDRSTVAPQLPGHWTW